MAVSDLLIDKRIVERRIRRGKLERTEYDRVLEELPDAADNVWKPEDEESGGAEDAPAPGGDTGGGF